MDNVSRYGFINAKLRARIGQMNDSSMLEKMIKAPTLLEAVSALKGTQYEDCLTVYEETGDLQKVELCLFNLEVEKYKAINRLLDPKLNNFISILLQKLEIENLKGVIRLWYAASVRHHAISYRSGYVHTEKIVYPVDYLLLLNASSYEDFVKAFEDTPYQAVVKSYSLERFAKEGLFSFETALDRLWYSILFAEIAKMEKSDKEVALKIYDVDMDLKNILQFLRYHLFFGCDKETVLSTMFPYGALYPKFVTAFDKGGDVTTAILSIIKRSYPKVAVFVEDLLSRKEENTESRLAQDTLEVEDYLALSRKNAFTRILSADPFTVGILLSYFFLSKREISKIKAILSAKYYNRTETEIREELV